MNLNTIKPAAGSVKKSKRIGRGAGSGHGKTSTKGHKGQKARSGGSIKAGFEGGQMPLQRRLPKRGFTPLTKVVFSLVNVKQLELFEDGAKITPVELAAKGIIKTSADNVKLLGNGSISKKIAITISKASQSAKEKIIAAGGSVEETL